MITFYATDTGRITGRMEALPGYSYEHLGSHGQAVYAGQCPADATHIINNQPMTIIPEPTAAEIQAGIVAAVQLKLDATARSRNYDGILSLCSYATSTDPTFAAEGQAGVVWRDACWRYCYQVLADVQAGARNVPSIETLTKELPTIVW